MAIQLRRRAARGLSIRGTLSLPSLPPVDRGGLAEIPCRGPEWIDRPDAEGLTEFYDLLRRTFRPGEVEPLEHFQRELAENWVRHAPSSFFALLLRDPQNHDRLVSGICGSVQGGVLALRFKLTDPAFRGTGLSQEADRLFFAEAVRRSAGQRQPLRACFGECVDRSEAYMNRVYGMRRLYVPGKHDSLHEVFYQLPHLGNWLPDGRRDKPLARPVLEHLQLAVANFGTALPVRVLREILTIVWENWYVLPPEEFATRRAWIRHRHAVIRQTLQRKILEPLRGTRRLILLSRTERQERQRRGSAIVDLAV